MTAKQYLKQAYRLNELIHGKMEYVKELRLNLNSVPGIDYSKDRVQTSPSCDAGFVNRLSKICDLEEEIKNDIKEMFIQKKEIKKTIMMLQNEKQQMLLQLRYINFEEWEQIAAEMSCNVFHVHKIHRQAIECMEELPLFEN